MISRIDHIALAVKDYKQAYKFFNTVFGAIPGSSSKIDDMKYFWQNMYLGDLTRLELLTPTGPGSFLDGFLAKKDGGVHHITMQTSDIKKAAEHLNRHGIPYFGYHEYGSVWKELFIHPKHAFGVLIQIAEFNPDDWIAPEVTMKDEKKIILEKHGNGCTIKFAHPGGGTVAINLNCDEMRSLCNELNS